MVHKITDFLWLGLWLGIAVAVLLGLRATFQDLLDHLFEEDKNEGPCCKACYGIGFDSSGQRCSCTEKEKR
jgi:hypothetical protein